jgi:hypothetical protein
MSSETVPLTSKNSTLLTACFERHREWLELSTSFAQSFIKGERKKEQNVSWTLRTLHCAQNYAFWRGLKFLLYFNLTWEREAKSRLLTPEEF